MLQSKAGNAIMVRQSERKHKAVLISTPEADTMRTIVATVVAVITALLLNNYTKPTPITVQHFEQVAITEHASAAPAEDKTATTSAIDKPAPETVPAVVAEKPAVAAPVAPTSSCAAEVSKYSSWNQTVAYNVMMAESSGNANTLNDNHATGDYSIGCFQINLKGDPNLLSKHRLAVQLGFTGTVDRALLTEWLKDPVNNVAIANKLYTIAGQWSDWQYTCQTKVQCY